MKPGEIVSMFRARGIEVGVEGGDLIVRATPGSVTTGLRDLLSRNKAGLLDFLRGAGTVASDEDGS